MADAGTGPRHEAGGSNRSHRPGPRTQWETPRASLAPPAVLTALNADGTPIYAQLRLLRPRADSPY